MSTSDIPNNSKVTDAGKSLSDGGRADVGSLVQEAQALDPNGRKGLLRETRKLEVKQQNASQVKDWRGQPLADLNSALQEENVAAAGRLTDSPAQLDRRKGLLKAITDQKKAIVAGNYLQYAADSLDVNLEQMTLEGLIPNPKKRIDFWRRASATYGEEGMSILAAPEIKILQKQFAADILAGDEVTLIGDLQDKLFLQFGSFLSNDEADAEINKIVNQIIRTDDLKTAYIVKSVKEQTAASTSAVNKYMQFRRKENNQ